jgi:membrane protein
VTVKTLWILFRETFRRFGVDRCAQMAAAIAYYILFSIIPLVTLLVSGFGLLLRDPDMRGTVVDYVLTMLPLKAGQGQNMVTDAIRSVADLSGALTVVGLAGVLWTAIGLFGAIREALNVAWNCSPRHGYLRQKATDLGAVLGLGLLIGGSLAGTAALHAAQAASGRWFGAGVSMDPLWETLGLITPALITFLAFLLLYRFVPSCQHGWRDVWPPALAASLLFEAGKHAFTFYVAHFNRYEVLYGALGAVMLFLLWTYVSAAIMLFGAELGSVYERLRRREGPFGRPRAASLAGA